MTQKYNRNTRNSIIYCLFMVDIVKTILCLLHQCINKPPVKPLPSLKGKKKRCKGMVLSLILSVSSAESPQPPKLGSNVGIKPPMPFSLTTRPLFTCCPDSPAQGWKPYVNISHNVTPNAQTSDAEVNLRKLIHSGAHLKNKGNNI